MARVAITGATGLIGGTLAEEMTGEGHEVLRLVRGTGALQPDEVRWDPAGGTIDAARLEGLDAVVHLAAEPLDTSRRGNPRERILKSRVEGTGLLARTLAALDAPPAVFVSASAVGVYGDRGDEVLTEESAPGDDFLAEVCVAWEAAASPAAAAGIRTVHPRTGVVIAERGPLIDKVKLPFRLGVGGRIGDGRQYVPWIALEDHVRALRLLIDSTLAGPVNLVAPEAVTNRELTRATPFPIPPIAIRLLYGEIAVMLAVSSGRVVPARLQAAGFTHRVSDLEAALRVALGRPTG